VIEVSVTIAIAIADVVLRGDVIAFSSWFTGERGSPFNDQEG